MVFQIEEEHDSLFNTLLETHTDIEDCKNLIESIEEKLDRSKCQLTGIKDI